MPKSLSTIVGMAGAIACTATFLATPAWAQSTMYSQTISPVVINPVSSADLANDNSQVESKKPSILPCIFSKSSKYYIQYDRYRDEVPNTPSDYSEAIAKYPRCNNM
jgi:hypothetical protein